MNPNIILKIIDMLASNKNDSLSEDMIKLLKKHTRIDQITFNREDRLKLALLALKEGIDIKEVAKVLSWKDFEYFAMMILEEHNYQVYNSVRINRLEIDIVAIDDLALAIDCKHWKYSSMFVNAIEKQIKRCKLLLDANRFDIKEIIPIILTLHPSIQYIENVPIVPIDKFDNFLLEFKGYIDSLLVIRV